MLVFDYTAHVMSVYEAALQDHSLNVYCSHNNIYIYIMMSSKIKIAD